MKIYWYKSIHQNHLAI